MDQTRIEDSDAVLSNSWFLDDSNDQMNSKNSEFYIYETRKNKENFYIIFAS